MPDHRKAYLETSENITSGILERFALLQGDAGCKSVPVLSNQRSEVKQDLLALQDARSFPFWESCCSTGDRSSKLGVGGLWHTSQEMVGGRIVEIDPFVSARDDELVVDEIGSRIWLIKLCMRGYMRRDEA